MRSSEANEASLQKPLGFLLKLLVRHRSFGLIYSRLMIYLQTGLKRIYRGLSQKSRNNYVNADNNNQRFFMALLRSILPRNARRFLLPVTLALWGIYTITGT